MGHQDVDVDFVYKLYGALAIRVISVVYRLEQRIAPPIQELLGDVGVPVQDCVCDFTVCVVFCLHVLISPDRGVCRRIAGLCANIALFYKTDIILDGEKIGNISLFLSLLCL